MYQLLQTLLYKNVNLSSKASSMNTTVLTFKSRGDADLAFNKLTQSSVSNAYYAQDITQTVVKLY